MALAAIPPAPYRIPSLSLSLISLHTILVLPSEIGSPGSIFAACKKKAQCGAREGSIGLVTEYLQSPLCIVGRLTGLLLEEQQSLPIGYMARV